MAKKSKEHGNAQREKAVQAPAPVEQPTDAEAPAKMKRRCGASRPRSERLDRLPAASKPGSVLEPPYGIEP